MLSGIITTLLLLLFLAGWAWAWSPRRKRSFDEAASLPLHDEVPVDEIDVPKHAQDESGATGVHADAGGTNKDSKQESLP